MPAREAHVERMISTLAHRGPDDAGLWSDPHAGVCLGHRRLAVIDCSGAGHQPMVSASGRYAISFNGEIYNHETLRAVLQAAGCAPAWRGSSDTEVLAAACDAWGIERAIAACVGMFAIAVWDREQAALTLARDRIGEKPLYYGRFRGTWLFGSELKALAVHPAFERAIDPQALAAYMRLGYVPAPGSIYRGVAKVQPGCLVRLDASGAAREQPYWSALAAARAAPERFDTEAQAIEATEALLAQAVAQQMVADRPLGALLSGGIDSSCVVALMRAHAAHPIQTFSIGFHESAFNEAEYARAVAQHLGTHHTDLYVTPAQAREVIPLLPQIYDEPFADSSQIPTYLVSRLARQSVTVALTGDGGDELFGGYPRYAMGSRLWSAIQRLPLPLRAGLGRLLRLAPASVDRLFALALPQDAASGSKALRPAQKLNALGHMLQSRNPAALYVHLLTHWAEPALLPRAARTARAALLAPDVGSAGGAIEQQFMLRDLLGYLPDDILVKTDRAAMAVSLETRAPLLDHRVVEFALRLPLALKMRQGSTKWLLRQVLYRHVPAALVDRPKMGFSVPIGAWLRGPLHEWAADLAGSSRGDAAQLLDRARLARLLREHATGVRDRHQALWTALMLLAWAEQVRIGPAGSTAPGGTAAYGLVARTRAA